MSNVSNFYDELDLKYPEIAIAIDDIDRINPGKIKCIIPVLTPNLDIDSAGERVVRQNSNSLMNASNIPNISNLTVSNYIYIKIPKELCSFVGGYFQVPKSYGWPEAPNGISKIDNIEKGKLTLNDAKQSGSGTVTNTSINVQGTVDSPFIEGSDIYLRGFWNLMPMDRYIKAPSKWIVVFIGGDITKPKIIGRYYDDE